MDFRLVLDCIKCAGKVSDSIQVHAMTLAHLELFACNFDKKFSPYIIGDTRASLDPLL